MARIVECVPNISEGRDLQIVEKVAAAVRETPGCALLDVQSDADHNRSVLSFIGEPEAVLSAAVNLCAVAVRLIDMTAHRGVHPRMGAVDVIPFVPIRGMEMPECVALSRRAGERIWNELGVPVFLYERSASAPHRRNLADVRRGEFEGMPEKLLRGEWAPDFGTRAIHPTAGAVAVGARMPLIAFNIDLNTQDVSVAKSIARVIRASSGGLPGVKAIGLMLENRNRAQVSINMVDYTVTPLHRALELVRAEAARRGVAVAGCEIIGLAPADALVDSAIYYLQLDGFDKNRQVLEKHLGG